MKKSFSKANGAPRSATQKKATELLDWLVDFLPSAVLPTLESAVLDESGEVHALLWHRSELQYLLAKEPKALTTRQLGQLANLDKKVRACALLLYASEKGTLQRYRQGRYDHSHWWWYLDDLLQEKMRAKRFGKKPLVYREADTRSLSKVAEPRAAYDRRMSKRKNVSNINDN